MAFDLVDLRATIEQRISEHQFFLFFHVFRDFINAMFPPCPLLFAIHFRSRSALGSWGAMFRGFLGPGSAGPGAGTSGWLEQAQRPAMPEANGDLMEFLTVFACLCERHGQ